MASLFLSASFYWGVVGWQQISLQWDWLQNPIQMCRNQRFNKGCKENKVSKRSIFFRNWWWYCRISESVICY